MPIPKLGTKSWEDEANFYRTSTQDQRNKRAKQLGYANRGCYQAVMASRGVHLNGKDIPAVEAPSVTSDGDSGSSLCNEEELILSIIRRSTVPISVSELSRQLDRSSETVIKFIDSLREKHYEVVLDELAHCVNIPKIPVNNFQPTEFKYFRKYYKIGAVTDTHMCSKFQQVTLLHESYRIFDDRQVDFIVHAGDIADGQGMYAGHDEEIFKHGAEAQRDYVEENYPHSKRKTKTYVIGGQHDFSFMKRSGYNIVSHICEKRDDLIYRGFFSARFKVKGAMLQVEHPGGGVAYARSYKPQKIIEGVFGSMASMVRTDPSEVLGWPLAIMFGHWHVQAYLPGYMGTDGISLPCLQSQTRYLQQHGLMPNVGCTILEIWLNEKNQIGSIKPEFIHMDGQIKQNDY